MSGGMESRQQHWETVHRTREQHLVGWYQATPTVSLELLRSCGVAKSAPVVDVGGGSSALVDHLVDTGHTDVSVLDISATALALARRRLGSRAEAVTWIECDVTGHSFDRTFDVWHDRAAFHFLTETDSQQRYVALLSQSLDVGGFAVIATFALNGPESCSGLPVQRYGPDSLAHRLGPDFEAVTFRHETHLTPGGANQEFLYGLFRRTSQLA